MRAGAGFLGTGGGNPCYGKPQTRGLIEDRALIQVVSLTDVPDDTVAVIGPAAFGYDALYRPLPGLYGGDVVGLTGSAATD